MTIPPLPPAGTPAAAPAADAGPGPDRPLDGDPRRRAVGRRGFVGALLAGTAATAAVAGFAAAPGEAAAGPAAVPGGAVLLTGTGVDPSGDADSTAGLQALVDAAPEGAWLWLPAGLYLVDGIQLRPGQMLSGPSARRYTGTAGDGARLRARLATQTGPVLVVGELGRVSDVAVEGNDRRQPAVRPGGFGAVLERVTMVGASVGFDASYVSGCLLTECQVHENEVGIKDVVDSVVQATAINANTGDGISLGPGANDNTFLGNKIEWNDGCGISALQALHNVVLGGVIDRNGRAGTRFVECAHTSLVGAVLRRNGRLAASSPEDDCHVYQQDCTALVVTGVVTNEGRDDDDTSGYRSPAVAIREEGGTDVGYTGNDLTGRTSPVAIARGAEGTRGNRLLNLGVPGVQSVSGTRVRVATAELSLGPGATGSVTIDLDAVPAGALGTTYRLGLVCRETGTGARGAAEVSLLVSRDDGDAQVVLGRVDNRIGAEFGTADGARQVGAAVSEDGAALTLTVRNTAAAAVRVGVELS
jgi:Right handed beta helix region